MYTEVQLNGNFFLFTVVLTGSVKKKGKGQVKNYQIA